MDTLEKLVLLAVMTALALGVAQSSSSFCAQFFKDTITKEPILITVKDNKPVGTILKRYHEPLQTPRGTDFGVKLLDEGAKYFKYDNKTHELSIGQMLHKYVGKRFFLKARCRDFWEFIHFYFPVPVEVWFEVTDGNDPPAFINLPNRLILPEDVPKGRVVYQVEAGNIFDITPEYMEYDVGVVNVLVDGKEDHNALLLSGNRVILNRQFDFEAGFREIVMTLVVKDTNYPDSTESTLTFTLKDVDDMGPAFAAKNYYIPTCGEKPIVGRDCLKPEPKEMAADRDIEAKSPLEYRVIKGSPANWTDFFELDPKTGMVCQIQQINRTILHPGRSFPGFHNFTFSIQAYQTDNTSKYDEANLLVHVMDSNMHAPEFDPPVIDAAVLEWPRVQAGDFVAMVTAYDKDYGRNSHFRYEFDWNPENAFALDEVTGEVTIARPRKLDREKRAVWEIRVNAIETHSFHKRKSMPPGMVRLKLTDLNDNPPIFNKGKYEFSIMDNHESGKPVHKTPHGVLASDVDEGVNALIRYKIYETWRTPGPLTSQTDTDLFQIDELGAITTSKSLRFLRRQQIFPTYKLVIVAYDQPEMITMQKTATTEAYVHVNLANEHAPTLNTDELFAEVSEGVPMKTIISRIKATDEDGDEDIFLTYKLFGEGGRGRFRIDERGELRTAGLLDREKESEYKLDIRVSDGKFKTEAVFTVRVTDINDNPPYFSKRSYRFFVSENITSLLHITRRNGNGHNGNGVGGMCHFEGDPKMAAMAKDAAIGQVKASDRDQGENGEITYRLMAGIGSELFCIDTDGSIYVVMNDNDIMDKEKNDRISLIVEVTDGGSPPLKDIGSVTIILTDVNDNPPVFNFPEYTGFVTEDDQDPLEDQQVFLERAMTVTDADKSSRNNNHRFSIHGPGSELFTIDPKTGAMSVKTPGTIDCETYTLYEFSVVATDRMGTGLSGNATILIYVDDVNEYAPRFLNRYSFTLAANTPVGHVFGKLLAEDYDITPQNKHVTYLLTGGGGNKFAIDYETGELRVDGDLNEVPAKQIYNLTIQAVDTGKPRKSTTESVLVHVKLNNPPEFWNGHAYSVRESDLPGTVIGAPRCHDPDSATDPHLVVKFHVEDNPDLPFTVDTDRGSIILMREVDREEHDEFKFMMYAVDNGAPPATGSVTVTINIIDANDNPPMFHKSQYFGSVVEDDSKPLIGQEVKMNAPIKATDKDVTVINRDIRFSLMGEGHEVFEIDPIIGTISVKQPGLLDAETRPVYKLQVIATDRGGDLEGLASAAMLTIDVNDINDNAPQFQRKSYSFMVLGNSTIGTPIGRVQATDTDLSQANHEVLYILEEGGYGRFAVSLETGMLSVANWLDSQPALLQYKLIIQAVDKGYPPMNSHVEVNIALPDNLPPILDTSLTFHIMENMPVNTVVGRIKAFDPEEPSNNTMTFFLEDEAGSFVMQPNTGTLYARDSFDREKVESFEVPIFVVDAGAPAETSQAVVTVIVDDVNDNGPKFTRTRFDGGVKEDDTIPISSHDHKVQMHIPIEATDADATEEHRYLQYSVEGDDSRSFRIDSLTGQLEVARPRIIDCEKKQQYKFKVVVTDSGGLSASTMVHITVQDVNDNAPVFLKDLYKIRLTEDIVGQVIGKVSAADNDRTEVNNRVIYDLEKGGAGRFSINSQTGEIQTVRSLVDEPVVLKYTLSIRAIDTGLPQQTGRTTVIVTIPENNPPITKPTFEFYVVENVPSATVVGRVEAEDRDTEGGVNATRLHFSIKNDGLVPFKIDRATGVITTLGEVDSEKAESYVLIVQVGDQGIPPKTAMSKVKVIIEDVNDNAPAFTKKLYTGTVTEDDKVPIENQVVAMDDPIDVNDEDATEANRNIVYKLYGEKSDLFVIDQKTGVLRVKKAGTIDCEQNPTFSLVLSATDAGGEGLTAKAEVHIKVIDVNDNPPSFLVTNRVYDVDSETPAKQPFALMAAVDNDASPMNNRVIYLLEGGYGKFSLDQINGNLMANDYLFREPLMSEYRLKVRALDTGNPGLSSETEITVRVPKNVKPKFIGTRSFIVKEGMSPGTIVGKVVVTDTLKQGEIPKFFFEIDVESKDSFRIDPDTGSITTKVELDRETKASHDLIVTVSDYGSPRMSSSAAYTVKVEDINDNAPVFDRKVYEGKIQETRAEEKGGKEVVLEDEIVLKDLDEVQGVVKVSLVGYGSERFEINQTSLTVWKKEGVLLDSERMKMFNLTIVVTDEAGGLDLQSRAILLIDVTDINDNAPVFQNERYELLLDTDSSIGATIAKLEASDADITEENNALMYFIKAGGDGRFTIGVSTGELVISGPLDQEPMKSKYTLSVEAMDRGRPPLRAETTVVVNIPDNHPPDIKGPMTFSLMEDQPIATLLGTVKAVDADDPAGKEKLNFTILDESVPFTIDIHRGELKTSQILDYEQVQFYTFDISVKDNAVPVRSSTAQINITIYDVNDVSPKFNESSYQASLMEDDFEPKEGQRVVIKGHPIAAWDGDGTEENGQIHFFLKGDGHELLTMDKVTAAITVNEPGTIDADRRQHMNLTVIATDRNGTGRSSWVPLHINIEDYNDNSPEFELRYYEFDLSSSLDIGSVITTLKAVDADGTIKANRVMYVLDKNGYGKFHVDFLTGVLTIKDSLNREPVESNYTLVVKAIDSGVPPRETTATVYINVPDNYAPVIDEAGPFKLKENEPAGTVVGTIRAHDPNTTAPLDYSLRDRRVPFKINEATGIITTTAPVDRERNAMYDIEVLVTDRGSPKMTSTALVIINIDDVDDNPPFFHQLVYEGHVREDTNGDALADILDQAVIWTQSPSAYDEDATEANRQFRYSLEGDGVECFQINATSGEITVRHAERLDADYQEHYNFIIVATGTNNDKMQSKIPLRIQVEDVNDNAPTFQKPFYEVNMKASSAVGTAILTVKATDMDVSRHNRKIYYFLSGGYGKFHIDKHTGEISIADHISREPALPAYTLNVTAIDGGEPPRSASVEVNVTLPWNNAPKFTKAKYDFNVLEDASVNTRLGRVVADDKDQEHDKTAELVYYVQGSQVPFTVHWKTGTVSTTRVIDRENDEKFEITVFVKDNGSPSKTASSVIVVTVIDINDNSPMFSHKLYEGRVMENDKNKDAERTVIMDNVIMAKDDDKGALNGNITYVLSGPGSAMFMIVPTGDTVSLEAKDVIDYEAITEYRFQIEAKDQGEKALNSYADVKISVLDANDQPPVFQRDTYTFDIKGETPVGDSIGAVVATDHDTAESNTRTIYILRRGGFGKFAVDLSNGTIFVADQLGRPPIKGTYELEIDAIDSTKPSFYDTAKVSIKVPKNKPPRITGPSELHVAENLAIGTTIGRILAIDPDQLASDKSPLIFTILERRAPVAINSKTGILTIKKQMDREETEELTFTVEVKDKGSPEEKVTSEVRLVIDDENDNAPEFSEAIYYGSVLEDDGKPHRRQAVLMNSVIKSTDNDATPANRKIVYSLIGQESTFFFIDHMTGRLVVSARGEGKIDREKKAKFKFQVAATDHGGQGQRALASVIIHVEDTNDNTPQFTNPGLVFTAEADAKAGDVIGQIEATDLDATSPNKDIIYLVQNDAFGKFRVDIKTGEVIVLEGLYYRPRQEMYTLTVIAVDKGAPSLETEATYLIRVLKTEFNDLKPEFTGKTIFLVDEEKRIGSQVGQLTITDGDRSRFRLSIIRFPEEEQVPFRVDSSGTIFTTGRLDADTKRYHQFQVRATDDEGTNTTTYVSVFVRDLNDNPPKFSQNEYRHMVYAGFPEGTVVATPFAYDDVDDNRSEYEYSLSGGYPGYFEINRRTGEVKTGRKLKSVTEKTVLDYTIAAFDSSDRSLGARAKLVAKVIPWRLPPSDLPPVVPGGPDSGSGNDTISCPCCKVFC